MASTARWQDNATIIARLRSSSSEYMSDWWYSRADKKLGPFDVSSLAELISADELDSETLVWRDGMTNWQPLGNVSELAHLLGSARPRPTVTAKTENANSHIGGSAIEHHVYQGETGYTNGRNWRRFFARMIDLSLLGSISLFVVGLLPPIEAALETTNNKAVNTFLFVFFGTLAEGTVLGLFGQTPGKAFARIQVSTLRRTRLSFGQALSRSWEIWIHGLGIGLPIISLIALYLADRRVAKDGRASWDEGKYVVSFDPVGPLHFCALVVIWVVSVLLSIAVSVGIVSGTGVDNEALDTVAKRVVAKVEWRATTDTCPAELMKKAPEMQVSRGLPACKRQPMRCLSRCEDGDGPACQLLALLLQESKPDAGAHEPLFQQACKAGVISGCTNHAAALLEDRNSWACATKTFEQGCQYDDPWACTMFASNLARGIGTTKDLPKALKVLDKSCKHGDDDPACKAGMQLRHNIEDVQNRPKR